MKIFLGGTPVSNPEQEIKLQELFAKGHKLHSFYHCADSGFEEKWFKALLKRKIPMFMDSGAFSASTKNVTIDIYKYMDFLTQHKESIMYYANLDSINDPKKSLKNYELLRSNGFNPIPVFHYGEPVKYLEYMIDACDYIGVGGMVGAGVSTLRKWLDYIFPKYLVNKKGEALIKVHGFGITNFPLLFRYPWYSVDSTGWVAKSRFGLVFIPKHTNGNWKYDAVPLVISVSTTSPFLKQANRHIQNVSVKEKELLLSYIHSHGYVLGKSEFKMENVDYELKENERWAEPMPKQNRQRQVEMILEKGISNTYQLRDELNVIYHLELEKYFVHNPQPFNTESLQKTFF